MAAAKRAARVLCSQQLQAAFVIPIATVQASDTLQLAASLKAVEPVSPVIVSAFGEAWVDPHREVLRQPREAIEDRALCTF